MLKYVVYYMVLLYLNGLMFLKGFLEIRRGFYSKVRAYEIEGNKREDMNKIYRIWPH